MSFVIDLVQNLRIITTVFLFKKHPVLIQSERSVFLLMLVILMLILFLFVLIISIYDNSYYFLILLGSFFLFLSVGFFRILIIKYSKGIYQCGIICSKAFAWKKVQDFTIKSDKINFYLSNMKSIQFDLPVDNVSDVVSFLNELDISKSVDSNEE